MLLVLKSLKESSLIPDLISKQSMFKFGHGMLEDAVDKQSTAMLTTMSMLFIFTF
jgi:hypothetical protein